MQAGWLHRLNKGTNTKEKFYPYTHKDAVVGLQEELNNISKKEGPVGPTGLSAYQVAVKNGYKGTEVEWLASLHGKDGINGKDGASGTDGKDGLDGKDGKTAYQYAVDGGYLGTEEEFSKKLAHEVSYSDAITNNASGESIVLKDSAESKLEDLKVYGKSEQFTTTGANLLDISGPDPNYTTSGGITVERTGDGGLTFKGTATSTTINVWVLGAFGTELPTLFTLPAGKYYVSGVLLFTDQSCLTDGLTTEKPSGIFTISADANITGVRALRAVEGKTYDTVFYPMVARTDTPINWEPYTGGIPSPNPQYPQDIVSTGDDGDVEVGVYGGNLLDITKFNKPPKNTSFTESGITFTNVNDEYIIVVGTSTSYPQIYQYIDLPNGTYVLSGSNHSNPLLLRARIRVKGQDKYTDYGQNTPFEVTDNTESVQIMIQADANWKINAIVKPMLTRGTTPLPYEPYTGGIATPNPNYKQDLVSVGADGDVIVSVDEQTLTALTPNGLPGIKVTDASLATYTDTNGQMWCADEKDYERGVYVKRVGTEVFDGSDDEIWNYDASVNRLITDVMRGKAKTPTNDAQTVCLMCNSLICKNFDTLYSSEDGITLSQGVTITMRYSEFDSKAKWIEYLNANPITVQYILAEPIETPLTAEELEAYKALHTNYPTTTIISESHLDVKYKADTKNYIDNKFKELSTALVALGGV